MVSLEFYVHHMKTRGKRKIRPLQNVINRCTSWRKKKALDGKPEVETTLKWVGSLTDTDSANKVTVLPQVIRDLVHDKNGKSR
jgi:hypothetical protein